MSIKRQYRPVWNEEEQAEIWAEIDGLEKRVNEMIMDHATSLVSYYTNCVIYECESPIEQIMAIALDQAVKRLEQEYPINDVSVIVHNQKEIIQGKRKYRADFLIASLIEGRAVELVVECDGHNFHERTKEQARRDKSRDRQFLAQGIPVLRFTGSEIWNDPFGCAAEVTETLKVLAAAKQKG